MTTQPEPTEDDTEDSERISLYPLTFEEAVKAALATPKPDDAEDESEEDSEAP